MRKSPRELSIPYCPNDVDRFLTRVPARPGDGCWIFQHSAKKTRYARFYLNYQSQFAHRASYAIFNGPVPAGKVVMHMCDNPPCVNPAHLKLGTHQDNSSDAVAKGRMKRAPGWVHPNPPRRRSGKINDEIVRAIRASRESLSVLALRYNIDPSMASYVRNRKRWAWVEDLPHE